MEVAARENSGTISADVVNDNVNVNKQLQIVNNSNKPPSSFDIRNVKSEVIENQIDHCSTPKRKSEEELTNNGAKFKCAKFANATLDDDDKDVDMNNENIIGNNIEDEIPSNISIKSTEDKMDIIEDPHTSTALAIFENSQNTNGTSTGLPMAMSIFKTKVEIKFIGELDGNKIWIKIPKPPNNISLADIKKHLMNRPESYGISNSTSMYYEFKKKDEKMEVGFEEIDEDDMILPLFGDKIILQCWSQKKC